MINFFSNIFGYILNLIYEFVNNYGLAIIIFSVLIKIVMLPLSIKQQRTLKKNEKLQEKIKIINLKHNGNQEKIQQEMLELYKTEKINPFGGCFSLIIQFILLLAMFSLVRSPLTYMKKIDNSVIEDKKTEIIEKIGSINISNTYPEISVIKYIQDRNLTDSELYINMNFLGIDLSKVPQENMGDFKVYIIPVLYVISSVISIKISTNMNNKEINNSEEDVKKEDDENDNVDPTEMAQQMNKSMSFMMPLLSVTISLVAPLGLALYWLVNNIIMIIERLILDKIISKEEENA